VRPGDPAGRVLRADTFNALLDAAALVRGLRGADVGSPPVGLLDVKPHNTVWVRAHAALPIGAVVRIVGAAAWNPALDPVTASRRPAFDTASPAKGEPFVILQEPAADADVLARAAVSGAALVRLRVADELYDFADVEPGDTAALKSVPHGAARVLWVEETGSAERWAVVRLDDGDFQAHVLITGNVPDADGYYPGEVQRYDVATKTWQTLFACKVVDINQ
jgi:hypothetical protein